MRYATGQVAAGEWQDNRLIEADPTAAEPPADAETPQMPDENQAQQP